MARRPRVPQRVQEAREHQRLKQMKHPERRTLIETILADAVVREGMNAADQQKKEVADEISQP